jgi:hypothetical protein
MQYVHRTIYPSEGVVIELRIDKYDGDLLDTSCKISGGFCISAQDIEVFNQKIGQLIDQYRI